MMQILKVVRNSFVVVVVVVVDVTVYKKNLCHSDINTGH